jgi:hypothetical protein
MVLRQRAAHGLGVRVERDLPMDVRRMIGRMPQWLRADLSANDAIIRERAEDALSAMIVAALAEPDGAASSTGSPSPSPSSPTAEAMSPTGT